MNRKFVSILAAASAFGMTSPAWAAFDTFLQIEGVEGEASTKVEVQSWSLGASNPTSVGSSGMSQGRLRESPTLPSRPRVVGQDMAADLRTTATQDEIQGFTLTLDGSSPQMAALCATGKHFPKATLTARGDAWELENVIVSSCSTAAPASAPASQAGQRATWDLKQGTKRTQSAPVSAACASGQCTAATTMTMTITGQMRHTKSGHVTLLK